MRCRSSTTTWFRTCADNETIHEVVQARLSRRALIGGSVAGAAALTRGSAPSSGPSPPWPHRRPVGSCGAGAAAWAARVHADPGVDRRHRRRAAGLHGAGARSRGATRCRTARRSARTPATPPPTRPSSGACTTTASSTSRCAAARARGCSSQNSEYTDDVLLFPDGTANWTAEKTAKSQNAHGVNIIHVRRGRGRDSTWEVVRPSPLRPSHHRPDADRHRRPAGRTPDDRLKTQRRPDRAARCSARSTTAPWASRRGARTWPARRTSTATSARPAPQTELERRYGITAAGAGYLWHTTDTRFQRRRRAERAEPVRVGRRDRPVRPDLDAGQAHGARSHQARGRLGAGGPRRSRRRLHRRRRAVRVHLPLRVEPAVAAGAGARASTRSTTAMLYVAKFLRRRHGRVAAADARQPGARRVVAQRHPDQHPRRRRRRRRDADGPTGVDRHVPRPPRRPSPR